MNKATDVIAMLESLNKDELETVLRRTLKRIVQLEYRELMNENTELREKLEELETANEEMLEKFSDVQKYIDAVNYWAEDVPSEPDLAEYV